MCELYPGSVLTPVALATAVPGTLAKIDIHSMVGWTATLQAVTVFLALATAAIGILIKRGRYERFLTTKQISRRKDPSKDTFVGLPA
jgi:hypothetical protein